MTRLHHQLRRIWRWVRVRLPTRSELRPTTPSEIPDENGGRVSPNQAEYVGEGVDHNWFDTAHDSTGTEQGAVDYEPTATLPSDRPSSRTDYYFLRVGGNIRPEILQAALSAAVVAARREEYMMNQ
ncbi:hypothetical protein MMC06_005660 [Schaereria dolodes]|nr:hypothetical protein [Schaereria dolodes]